MARKASIKVGNRYLMKENGWLTVVAYANCREVTVVFDETGYETTQEAVMIKRGTIRDYMRPSVYGYGYLGVGEHIAYTNNKPSWVYTKWVNMLHRCYCIEYHAEKPSYGDCSVEKSWHNFQTFADWAVKQVGCGTSLWALDKDIVNSGNRQYSEANCCFLPNILNCLLNTGKTRRGDCVIGVTYVESSGMYRSQCNMEGERNGLGMYSTELGAFDRYKEVKEKFIKEQANKWQSQIDPRAYQALMNYQVDITD